MPWVRFTANHDHVWPSGAHSAFPSGATLNVKREVAELAVRLDRAEYAKRPPRVD